MPNEKVYNLKQKQLTMMKSAVTLSALMLTSTQAINLNEWVTTRDAQSTVTEDLPEVRIHLFRLSFLIFSL